MDFIVCW